MNMRLCLLISLILSKLIVCAQDSILVENDILKTKNLKKGIYYDFTQFKLNSPSTEIDFCVKSKKKKKDLSLKKEMELIIQADSIHKVSNKKHIWGVCDGENVFVNNDLISSKTGFYNLVKLDYPISYFYGSVFLEDEDPKRASMAVLRGGAMGGISAAIPYWRLVALDMRKGEFIRLNNQGFLKLLKDDEVLLRRYNIFKDYDNNEKLLINLIDEYNQKYRSMGSANK